MIGILSAVINTKMTGMLLFAVMIFTASASEVKSLDEFTCNCGIFTVSEVPPGPNVLPLINKATSIPLVVNEESRLTCIKYCILLAKAGRANAPLLLCSALKSKALNYDRIEGVAVYSHSNGEIEKWVPTGAIHKAAICCKDGAPVACDDS